MTVFRFNDRLSMLRSVVPKISKIAGKAVYTVVRVAAVALFMELLGFSTQKCLIAGGLGTVLLTFADRE
ncbi:hypothetical protein Droror1_Dr00017634, partial [Drosera rotundifolia]